MEGGSAYESMAWTPFDVRWGIVRDSAGGRLIGEGAGSIVWERLDTQERIALGYLLSKALGHPNLREDGEWMTRWMP